MRSVPCSMRCTGRPRPIPDDALHALYDKLSRSDVLQRAWVQGAATAAHRASTE